MYFIAYLIALGIFNLQMLVGASARPCAFALSDHAKKPTSSAVPHLFSQVEFEGQLWFVRGIFLNDKIEAEDMDVVLRLTRKSTDHLYRGILVSLDLVKII